MTRLSSELRAAMRGLAGSLSFTIPAVVAFAIGIGGVSTIFSLVHHVYLTPSGFDDPQRLVTLRQNIPSLSPIVPFSEQVFEDFRARAQAVEDIAAVDIVQFSMASEQGPVRYTGARVTDRFFPMSGIRPALGRLLDAEDYSEGRRDVVLISHSLWQSRFGGDPSILGRRLEPDVTGRSVPRGLDPALTVVGVLPPDLWVPWGEVDLWLPVQLVLEEGSRHSPYLFVLARLASVLGVDDAQARLDDSFRGLEFTDRWPQEGRALTMNSLAEMRGRQLRSSVILLWVASGLVLVVVCANLANLVQARTAGRRGEVALRLALGASRFGALRQPLAESTILAVLGGAAGIALSFFALEVVRQVQIPGLFRPEAIQLNPQVLAFSLAAATLSLVLFAIIPIWFEGRVNPAVALAADSVRATGNRRAARLRSLMIAGEMGVAIVLLVAAAAAFGSLVRLSRIETGFVADGALIHELEIPVNRFPETAQQEQIVAELLDTYRAIPSVQQAAAVHMLPLSLANAMTRYRLPGGDESLYTVNVRRTSEGYLDAMGIPLLAGRGLVREDLTENRNVVLVNRKLAEKHWPGASPIGEQVLIGGQNSYEIVGVVGDVRQWQLTDEAAPSLYRPGFPTGRVSFVLRSTQDPETLISTVRRETLDVNDRLLLHSFSTMRDSVDRSIGTNRLTSGLFSTFAGLALLIAVVGVYGVMSYSIAGRRREIGVRMALGASRTQILRQLLLEGWTPALLGSLLGLTMLFPLASVMEGLFYEFSLGDPRLWLIGPLVLNAAALIALWIPSRRASRLEPQHVLRDL